MVLLRSAGILAIANGVLGAVSPSVTLAAPEPTGTGATFAPIPNSYIVQLDDTVDSFSDFRSSARVSFEVRQEFTDSSVFYGLSITVPSESSDVVQTLLESHPQVIKVWPNRKITLPPGFRGSRGYGNETAARPGPGKPSPPPKITGNADVLSPLKMMDVDKLHALGVKGKGIKIGIIDTGVDYRHPSLGGGFGPKFKIAGGHAWVDDEWDGGPIVESNSPLTTCTDGGHGTHTAGIVGMDDPHDVGFGLRGIAPEATLYAYRVFGCYGTTSDEILMMAFHRAAQDGVHLTSNSWGGSVLLEADNIYSVVTANLAKKGIATIAAAGNDGMAGLYSASSPAMSPAVVSVGSVSNTKYPLLYQLTDSRKKTLLYSSVWPLDYSRGINTYLMGSGQEKGCNIEAWEEMITIIPGSELPKTMVILPGQFCLGTPVWPLYNVTSVLVGEVETADPFASDLPTIVASDWDLTTIIGMGLQDSKTLYESYSKAGGYGKHKLFFTSKSATSVDQATGGHMSNFSSFGLTWDTLAMTPQLSAPGGNILSTWTLTEAGDGGYGILSGTSMATPFVAGAWALVKSQMPHLSVEEIRNLLQTTASPVSWLPDKSILSSTAHQGSGLINPYKAIFAKTQISPGQLELGDVDSFKNNAKKITIKNTGVLPRVYTISHRGAGFVEHFPYSDLPNLPWMWYKWGQPQYANYGSAKFSTTSIILAGGSSKTFTVTISPPKSYIERADPVFSGYITVSAVLGETLVIPYTGLPYSRKSAEYFDFKDDSYAPVSFQVTKTVPVDDSGNFIDQVNGGLDFYNMTTPETIRMAYHTVQYSALLRIDVVPADIDLKATHYGYDPNPDEPYHIQDSKSPLASKFLGIKTYGNFVTLEKYTPSKDLLSWRGSVVLDDGTTVDLLPGDYRFLMSALKSGTSDSSKVDSYETWLSPILRLER